MIYMAVGLAGVIGALLRYYTGQAVHWELSDSFPMGTLLVNLIGCLVLGWFSTWVTARPSMPTWFRLGFGTGLIGSFTTFSTFSVDTMNLIHQERWGTALVYVLLCMWVGWLLAWAGYELANLQIRKREAGLGG